MLESQTNTLLAQQAWYVLKQLLLCFTYLLNKWWQPSFPLEIKVVYSFYDWIAVFLCHYYAHCMNSANKTNTFSFPLLFQTLVTVVYAFCQCPGLEIYIILCTLSASPYQHSRFLVVSSSFAIAGISWMIVLGQTFLYATLQRQ